MGSDVAPSSKQSFKKTVILSQDAIVVVIKHIDFEGSMINAGGIDADLKH